MEIKEAEIEDSGKYTCKIEEFGKEGDSETTCEVNVGGEIYKTVTRDTGK